MTDGRESGKPARIFTSADRIRQLNEVDKDVARLIHSAGLAIQALTNARSNDSSSTTDNSLDSHKSRFKEATSQYFALLSSIDVRLRRQVYALEESAILAPDSSSSRTGDLSGTSAGVTGAAANPLDVSWLNSRKDTVGKEKEAELWAAAREFVEQLGHTSREGSKDSHESMEVD